MMQVLRYWEQGPGQQQMEQQQAHAEQTSTANMQMPQIAKIFSALLSGLTLTFFLIFSTVDTPFETMGNSHLLLGLAWQIINNGFLLAVGAALIGGAPIVIAAFRARGAARTHMLKALFLPLLIPLFIITMVMLGNTPFYSYNLFLLLAYPFYFGVALLFTAFINRGMRQTQIPERWQRLVQACTRLMVFALVLLSLGLFAWGIFTMFISPALFFSLANPLSHLTVLTWLLVMLGMGMTVNMAARTLSQKP